MTFRIENSLTNKGISEGNSTFRTRESDHDDWQTGEVRTVIQNSVAIRIFTGRDYAHHRR